MKIDDHTILQRELGLVGGLLNYDFDLSLVNGVHRLMFSDQDLGSIFTAAYNLKINTGRVDLDRLKIALSDIGKSNFQTDDILKKCLVSSQPIDKTFIDEFIKSSKIKRASKELEELTRKLNRDSFEYNQVINKIDDIRSNVIHLDGHIKEFTPGSFLEKRIQILQKREGVKQIFYNVPPLDHLIKRGQRKGEISVIAARPSIGKSLAKANLIKRQCEAGFKICSVATEQTDEVETDRIDSLITGIPLTEIENSAEWEVGDPRIEQLIKANRKIDENWDYYLRVDRNLTLESMGSWLRELVNKHGEMDVCYIDLFDKLKDVNVALNKAGLVGEKLGRLNQIAEELNIHFCLIVQINRELRHIKGHRPRVWHIKDSGAYEEVARLIILLHRESYYNKQIREHILEFNIAKQSNGPAGEGVIAKLDMDPNDLLLTWGQNVKPNLFEKS